MTTLVNNNCVLPVYDANRENKGNLIFLAMGDNCKIECGSLPICTRKKELLEVRLHSCG